MKVAILGSRGIPNRYGGFEELAEKWEWSQALAMNINLVIEEAVSNIIFYVNVF